MKAARITTVLGVGVVLLLALLTTPATADTRSFGDRAGDVRHGMDIRKVRVRSEQRLVVTTWHRSVQAGGIAFYFDTRPSPGPEYSLVAGVGYDTDWQVFRMTNWRSVGHPVYCPSDYAFSRAADTVRASLSRTCVGGASRVRVSVRATARGGAPDWAPGYRKFYSWVAQ